MSEQSGGGPITREQVERAISKPRNIDYRELPPGWREWAPDYVLAAEAADDWDAEHAALARWRDDLAAAEVRKVARWDAEAGLCALTPPRNGLAREATRAQAIAWGYEIEGGPEPVFTGRPTPGHAFVPGCAEHGHAHQCAAPEPDGMRQCGYPEAAHESRQTLMERARAKLSLDPHGELTAPIDDTAPERLRERREALGWTTDDAAAAVRARDRRFPHLGACHIEAIERPHACGPCNSCAAYAAALSAEEARRAVRPAPRFKVGDWVRVVAIGTVYQVGETAPVGEWVLVYNPRPYVSKGDVGAGITRDGRSWSRGNSELWWNPTHWQPLPAVPEAP